MLPFIPSEERLKASCMSLEKDNISSNVSSAPSGEEKKEPIV
jgi:hypothetical protein